MWAMRAEPEKSGSTAQQASALPQSYHQPETLRTMPPSVPAAPPVAPRPEKSQTTSPPRSAQEAAVKPSPISERPAASPAEPVWRGSAGIARLSRKSLLLVAAYGFGAVLAGVLQARGGGNLQTVLGLYLQNFADLLALRSAKGAVTLFGTQYFSLLAAVTLLLMAGLCAFGPLLICLFVIFYGVGVGTVGLQLLLQANWSQAALVLLFWGLPVSLAAACLCTFGSSALGVGLRLQTAAFGGKSDTRIASSTKRLVGQYLFWAVLLLPLCGVATALLYLLGGLG
jgi:hypothetical protein